MKAAAWWLIEKAQIASGGSERKGSAKAKMSMAKSK
jgi:hypothetical protein